MAASLFLSLAAGKGLSFGSFCAPVVVVSPLLLFLAAATAAAAASAPGPFPFSSGCASPFPFLVLNGNPQGLRMRTAAPFALTEALKAHLPQRGFQQWLVFNSRNSAECT